MDAPGIVMITLIVSSVGVIAWSLLLRYRRRELQHRERLAALEKGVALPDLTEEQPRAPWSPRVYLLRGMLWLFSGLGLMIFLAGISVTTSRPRSVEDRISRAYSMKDRGATEEQIRQVQNDLTPQEGMPLGVALFGLIPIGVGLAYLVFYRAEGQNVEAGMR